MSLHTTLHTATPAPSELVPSRHAVRIGEIDVLVVSDGVLPLPTKMAPLEASLLLVVQHQV
jgi:hypothetical protein